MEQADVYGFYPHTVSVRYEAWHASLFQRERTTGQLNHVLITIGIAIIIETVQQQVANPLSLSPPLTKLKGRREEQRKPVLASRQQ
jgi:hypothetical protein